ncbi:MAG: glycosyltransferase family 4 protein [Ginsengibacter sp.]
MQKKTIIHFIYSLGRGGAENMLVQALKELQEYNNIVVTLYEDNRFEKELQCAEYICLNKRSLWSLPVSVIAFRKLVKKYKPELVHSHLLLPNFIARLSTPRRIPLVTTIHNSVSKDFDYGRWVIRKLDRFTYRFRRSVIIAVSEIARQEYFTFLKARPLKSHLLYTFVDENIFNKKTPVKPSGKKFRIVAVGALRKQKNFEFLIEEFTKIKSLPVELHIYGDGILESGLQKLIGKNGVHVVLKGEVTNIHEILPKYDLYVSSSYYEGFSLAVLEAMAMKLPLLLSDIKSFREQCRDTAWYFNVDKSDDFISKLKTIMASAEKRNLLSAKAQKRVLENFTLSQHVAKLKEIYAETFAL